MPGRAVLASDPRYAPPARAYMIYVNSQPATHHIDGHDGCGTPCHSPSPLPEFCYDGGMFIGCARLCTKDQDTRTQINALTAAAAGIRSL
jgi:hypothetical protein